MAALEGRVPENALLSHDLFEGIYARAALVTDVELVDDYPSNVLVHAKRQHRWVRGDWQILLWLFPWVPTRTGFERNRLPLISRWTILDNLRRSLGRPQRGQGVRVYLRAAGEDLEADLARIARLLRGQGRLLQWETAAAVAQQHGSLKAPEFYSAMRASPLIAGLGLLLVIGALLILALWVAAPLIAFVLSKPVPSLRPEITDDDRAYLLTVAEQTWRYFDTFVTEKHRFLPPDNVQLDPEPLVA